METKLDYEVLELLAKNAYGFTIDCNGEAPKEGYVVSMPNYEVIVCKDMLDSSIIETYIKRVETVVSNSVKKYYIGCWLNETDNKYYLDVNLVLDNKNEAMETGRKHKQLAIFDLNEMSEIRL